MNNFKASFTNSEEILDMDTPYKWLAERMAYHYAESKGLHLKAVWDANAVPLSSEETT